VYENHPEYPVYVESQSYGFFGYPSAMLNLAQMKDDPEGFRFYFDRYFKLDCKTLGGSMIGDAANKGAEECVKALLEMGATDPSFSADELLATARKAKIARETQQTR
jgi:hypothetical protein